MINLDYRAFLSGRMIMEYRKTAQGDLISTIGIGSAQMHESAPDDIGELFAYAAEQGVNLLDLAMPYPEPLDHIGKALKGKRSKFFIQMHLGLTFPEGQYVRTRVLPEVKKGFEEQLRKLGTDHIDFGFIHYVDDIEDFEEVLSSGVFDYAKQLKKEGKIRYLGGRLSCGGYLPSFYRSRRY